MARHTAFVSWSGGKDSAFAMERACGTEGLEVVGLFTTLDAATGRVFHHDIPEALIAAQAEALGLELCAVRIAPEISEAEYGEQMRAALAQLSSQGVDAMVFGDIHLADVRDRRESKLAGTGIQPLFPLWGDDPETLADEMIAQGVEATIVSIDTRCVGREALGAPWGLEFLDALPAGADRCGEQGEYHTFVNRTPRFRRRIETRIDTVVERPPFAAAVLTAVSASDGHVPT